MVFNRFLIKYTSFILLSFFFIFIIVFSNSTNSYSKINTTIDNNDSLKKYLTIDKDSLYPSFNAVVLHQTLEQELIFSHTSIKFDIAYKIHNADAVNDLFNILLPKNLNGGSLKKFKAYTYNFENGNIVTSEITNRNLDETKVNNELILKKTSFKNVKNGSIIRFSYEIRYAGYMKYFEISSSFPILEYKFKFVYKNSNNDKYNFSSNYEPGYTKFSNLDSFNSSNEVAKYIEYKFINTYTVMVSRRNIVPQKVELFSSNNNSKENFEFNFDSYNLFNPKNRKFDWHKVVKDLYTADFVNAFIKHNFIDSIILVEKWDMSDTLKAAKMIFEYVRNNYSYKNTTLDSFELIKTLKYGNSNDLNMLLCTFYRHIGIASDIIAYTTDKKNPLKANDSIYWNQLDGIAVRVITGGKIYFADVSQKRIPFGYLPYNYYNGPTLVINKVGGWIDLQPELAKDYSNVSVNIVEKDSNKYELIFEKSYGVYSSNELRNEYKDSTEIYNDYKSILSSLSSSITISNYRFTIENFKDFNNLIKVTSKADFVFDNVEDIMLMDPFLQKVYNGENPFLNINERKTAIELNYCQNRSYTFNIKLNNSPYKIEEAPKSINVQYGTPKLIGFQNKIQYNRLSNEFKLTYVFDNIPAHYNPEELSELKEFFNDISRTFSQKIVLKK